MSKHAITILFLILAIIFYGFGFGLQATILIGLGMLAELVFWVRALMSLRNNKEVKSQENNE